LSVDFYPAASADGRPLYRCACEDGTCRACETRLNFHARRAADVFAAVDLLPYGALPAADVAARCRAYLRTLTPQPARPVLERGRVVFGGAPAGDTRDTVARLLEVALVAGEIGWVAWG
jgi:hypothetical protein